MLGHLYITFLGIAFGHKGLLLLFGLLLAYETRNVKLGCISDSRFTAMAVYNVVVLSVVTAPVSLILGDQQDAHFAFVAVAVSQK
ncbi:unnamed protein product [Protopolystoma xenopodis]|uniref:G-protein coupled receptors family 3 profile domain-containing protein n=1 Tax=Protopolystoma xenopodis TaxID=117903 RepID=A0A3S5CE28_9PLAT|nr:unnamed protein product [Protopolystoma xenopodis]